MASQKVIVFGPTGAVGSLAARTASELGAKVVLAMRDPSKTIPGIDAATEKQNGFERVQADLSQPDTVRNAVSSTGAKRAFLYLAVGSPDNMKATIEALKAGGVDLVVFLSSFTVRGDKSAIPQSHPIPYWHAQVEINLEEVFGRDAVVALRPGSFAGNTLQHKAGIQKGEVKVFRPDARVDCIVQADIGRVAGTVLARGPQDDNRAIYLYGPELLPQKDVVATIAKVLGKDAKVVEASEDEALQMFVGGGFPEPVAKYALEQFRRAEPDKDMVFGYAIDLKDRENVEKYSGKKSTSYQAWVQDNKQLFA